MEIKNLLQTDPASVPGYGLRDGRNIETVTNPIEVHNRFCGMGGKTEEFMSAVKIVKGELKDQVRTVTELKGKALDAQMDALLNGCTVSTKSAPTIERLK